MLNDLKEKVCKANIELYESGVVIYTWGNVSGIDRKQNLVAIKPSGVPYEDLTPEKMVVLDLFSGEVVDGNLLPSSDTKTHLELYKAFSDIGGIAHTHSINAVAYAQAGKDIPALGTTHADYFYGSIPCTRELTEDEVNNDYELNTGKVIIETFQRAKIKPATMPGIIVRNHGPFAFGETSEEAVYHAVVLETLADMCLKTQLLNSQSALPQYILEKHFFRKHGPDAYYGQNEK